MTVFAFVLWGHGCAALGQSLRVEPATIEAGAEATLIWSDGGDLTYITGVGRVADQGVAQVHPVRSTTYWLVAERGGATLSASAVLTVTGQREVPGSLDVVLPPITSLSGGKRREAAGVPFTEFLDAVDAALRDAWAAEPLWLHRPHEPFYTAVTLRLVRPEFVRPSDKGIGQRRVAFVVRAYEPASASPTMIAYELQSKVESRLRNEADFVEEKDPTIARDLVDKLDTEIRRLLKPRSR